MKKITTFLNKKKTRNPFFMGLYETIYHGSFLYFNPLPHGEELKQLSNYLLENWAFLFRYFNDLLINCKKVMSIFLTPQFNLPKNVSKKVYLMHLSEVNNNSEVALKTVYDTLNEYNIAFGNIKCAEQDNISELMEV